MIINRHNYEEIFLLYVDNELTTAQRATVEAFVQQNEDLADELKMLQQVTLLPEEGIQYSNKQALYKREQGISLANCEEYFLLDVDNELSSIEKDEVEKFVLQHPQVQESFTLLHKTKLEAEAICFENKTVLYRKEERRVVSMRWLRMAAAAAIIAVVGTLYLTIDGKNVSDGANTVATQPKKAKETEQVQAPVIKDKADEQVAVAIDPKVEVRVTTPLALPKPKIGVGKKSPVKEVSNNVVASNRREPKPDVKTNDLPVRMNKDDVAVNNQGYTQESTDLAPNIINRNTNSNTISEKTKNTTLAAAKMKEDENNLIKQAVYREIDNNNEEEENTFLIGSARINKNKLKGLFKKASGLFNKKGDKNEHQKSIQIAGFEIKS